jgi:signal transduction histidine kinase
MHTEDKIIYILITSMSAIGIVIGYFIYSMMRLHRNYLLVHEQQDKAKILAVEKERQLIAADLHDDIGPVLSSVIFKLGEVDTATEKAKQLLTETINHVDQIFGKVRSISSMLVPSSLARRGPLYAIEEFTSLYANKYPLKISVSPVPCEGLSAQRALHIFRMLQEIVQNTVKHAKASHLKIMGEATGNELIIRTSDDGVGYNVNDSDRNNGLGLQNLKLRAQMINAKFITNSIPGSGTTYLVQLALIE